MSEYELNMIRYSVKNAKWSEVTKAMRVHYEMLRIPYDKYLYSMSKMGIHVDEGRNPEIYYVITEDYVADSGESLQRMAERLREYQAGEDEESKKNAEMEKLMVLAHFLIGSPAIAMSREGAILKYQQKVKANNEK